VLYRYPGLPCAVSWSAILVVAIVLCSKTETRDHLLGKGKVLSLVSVGALAIFIALTLVGWSIT
jgi:divalent metal cation (Fe/Co/Zn/Cd) transporter